MQLQLDELVYSYSRKGGFTLGPLSLTLPGSTITALIGSNGSGKTTLIKVLLNEFTGYSGTYRIDGETVKDQFGNLMHRFGIGYAPEQPVLEERLTGMEIMQLLQEVHEIPEGEFNRQVDECKKALHCEEWFDRTPCRECSQGMRKKVSLMIALVGKPRYIIIDEPTNGLDPLATFGLKRLLARYCELGTGALVSSHMLDFVERVARDVVIVKNGKKLFSGTVEELFVTYPNTPLDEIYYRLFNDDLPEPEL